MSEPREPLTRAILERALVAWSAFENGHGLSPGLPSGYVTEILCLAMAALGRLAPNQPPLVRRRDDSLEHEILELLRDGPKSAGELIRRALSRLKHEVEFNGTDWCLKGDPSAEGYRKAKGRFQAGDPDPYDEKKPEKAQRASRRPAREAVAAIRAGRDKVPTKWLLPCPDFKITLDDGAELDLGCLFGDEICEQCGHELAKHQKVAPKPRASAAPVPPAVAPPPVAPPALETRAEKETAPAKENLPRKRKPELDDEHLLIDPPTKEEIAAWSFRPMQDRPPAAPKKGKQRRF